MRITQEADYALRMCSALAQSDAPMGAPKLSQMLSIPTASTSKVLRKLMLSCIVKSTRGANGGFSLEKSPDTITLRQVIEAVDGKIAIRHCIEECHICNFQNNKNECRFHCVFEQLNTLIQSRLDSLSIGDMVNLEIPVEELTTRLLKN